MRETVIFLYVFSGAGVKKFFSNEVGGHTFSRVPPTESKGRVHTSSVTVAILEESNYKEINLYPDEYRLETTRGSGNGGQHKNTTDSCVIVTHYATKIKVVRDGRNQYQNKDEAIKELNRRVNEFYRTGVIGEEVEGRRKQIGSGSRGEKRRTYTFKSDLIVDHVTGKRTSLKQVFKGNLKLLHI